MNKFLALLVCAQSIVTVQVINGVTCCAINQGQEYNCFGDRDDVNSREECVNKRSGYPTLPYRFVGNDGKVENWPPYSQKKEVNPEEPYLPIFAIRSFLPVNSDITIQPKNKIKTNTQPQKQEYKNIRSSISGVAIDINKNTPLGAWNPYLAGTAPTLDITVDYALPAGKTCIGRVNGNKCSVTTTGLTTEAFINENGAKLAHFMIKPDGTVERVKQLYYGGDVLFWDGVKRLPKY